MRSKLGVKDLAIRMAVRTGDMPDVDFIWKQQETEGNNPCFGHIARCRDKLCRWRKLCVALDFFEDVHLPLAKNSDVQERTPETEPNVIIRKTDPFVERASIKA